jgi:hypothetical protein
MVPASGAVVMPDSLASQEKAVTSSMPDCSRGLQFEVVRLSIKCLRSAGEQSPVVGHRDSLCSTPKQPCFQSLAGGLFAIVF